MRRLTCNLHPVLLVLIGQEYSNPGGPMKSTLQPLSTSALAIFFLFASSTFGQSLHHTFYDDPNLQSNIFASDLNHDGERDLDHDGKHGRIEWTQYGFLPTHTSFNSREKTLTRANVASLTFQWAAEVGPGIASAPVVGLGIVYAAADGTIFAFRASDGKPLWSHLSCTGVDTVQPALGPHALLVGDGGGDMAAYDPVTGDQIWCDDIGGSITSAPAVDEKTVYFTDGFEVVAVNQLTGTALWRFAPGDSSPLTNTPAIFRDMVFVTGGDSVFALDKTTGHELWRTDLGPEGISSAPSVAGNTVYVGGHASVCVARLRWTSPLERACGCGRQHAGDCPQQSLRQLHRSAFWFMGVRRQHWRFTVAKSDAGRARVYSDGSQRRDL
jgi:outer membrane protein assembly factor BamB